MDFISTPSVPSLGNHSQSEDSHKQKIKVKLLTKKKMQSPKLKCTISDVVRGNSNAVMRKKKKLTNSPLNSSESPKRAVSALMAMANSCLQPILIHDYIVDLLNIAGLHERNQFLINQQLDHIP